MNDNPADARDLPRTWRRRLLPIVAPVLGIVLVVAAIVTALGAGDGLAEAWANLRAPAPLPLAGLFVSIVLSLLLNGELLRVLTSRFAVIDRLEMQALCAAATLANTLPLRAGFIGRAAWQRTRHGVRVRDTVRTLVESMVATAVASALLFGGALIMRDAGDRSLALALPWIACIAAAAALLFVPRTRVAGLVLLLRVLDLAFWTVRIACAFALIGTPIDAVTATALAATASAANLVPIVGNGLGLREWASGLLAPLLVVGATSVVFADGVAAELVVRAAELLVVLPAGLFAGAWLARRARITPARSPDHAA